MALLSRRIAAEAVGAALLLAAVVGSGIMAERLSAGNSALALLANAVATGGALVALILALGPISGAHLNPVVTVADAAGGGVRWAVVPVYVAAQMAGAVTGVALAHVMFGLSAFSASTHVRSGVPQVFAEAVATFGLLLVIWGCSRHRPGAAPYAVAAFIVAAYWFTSSTSFANPAVTVARSLTDTFSGIRPADVPGFLLGQAGGALAAIGLCRWLDPHSVLAAAATSPEELSDG
ncbi:MAG TPA: MIP/aquaporin family protein [Myxococcaceae bacterium]|nr:MIP/aquaporin family protein [Myxococcaceae bacterium]